MRSTTNESRSSGTQPPRLDRSHMSNMNGIGAVPDLGAVRARQQAQGLDASLRPRHTRTGSAGRCSIGQWPTELHRSDRQRGAHPRCGRLVDRRSEAVRGPRARSSLRRSCISSDRCSEAAGGVGRTGGAPQLWDAPNPEPSRGRRSRSGTIAPWHCGAAVRRCGTDFVSSAPTCSPP